MLNNIHHLRRLKHEVRENKVLEQPGRRRPASVTLTKEADLLNHHRADQPHDSEVAHPHMWHEERGQDARGRKYAFGGRSLVL